MAEMASRKEEHHGHHEEEEGHGEKKPSGMPFAYVLTLYERNLHEIFYRNIYICNIAN
jgi:hypothetical protein